MVNPSFPLALVCWHMLSNGNTAERHAACCAPRRHSSTTQHSMQQTSTLIPVSPPYTVMMLSLVTYSMVFYRIPVLLIVVIVLYYIIVRYVPCSSLVPVLQQACKWSLTSSKSAFSLDSLDPACCSSLAVSESSSSSVRAPSLTPFTSS